MSNDAFRKAEDEYFLLRGRLETKQITREQFESALQELLVQDADGRYWMIGADSGKWYVHNGQTWIESKPGAGAHTPATPRGPTAPPPPPIVVTDSMIMDSGARNSRGGAPNRTPILTGIAIAAVLIVCGVAAFLFAANQGIIQVSINKPSPTLPAVAPLSQVTPLPIASPAVVYVTPTPTPPQVAPTQQVAIIAPTATIIPTASAANLMTQADALYVQGKLSDAGVLYERAVEQDKSNALAYARWARVLDLRAYLEYRDEYYADAVAKAQAAAQIAPSDPEVAIRLSRAYDWAGTTDKALAAGQNAVKLAPTSAEAYAVLAEALLDSNKLQDAETQAQKAVQLDPNSAEAHRIMAYVLGEKNQVPAAIAEFEKAEQIEPNLGERPFEVANYYRSSGDLTGAIPAYQRAIDVYPSNARAYVGQGTLYRDLKQYDKSVQSFNAALKINDRAATTYSGLGRTYQAAGKCAEGIPALQKSLELNAQSSVTLVALGWCQLQAGNFAGARDAAQKAAAIDPNNADVKNLQSAVATAMATPTPAYTATPVRTATPAAPPGLYVTQVRTEPSPAMRGQDVGFYVTFLNTLASEQNYRWMLYIYHPDNFKNSFGETTPVLNAIPIGSGELKSLGIWKTGIGACDYFVLRVVWLDENRKATPFTKPDGSIFEQGLTVCP